MGYFARPNHTGCRTESKAGYIEMQGPPPSPQAVAQEDGTWLEPPVDTAAARRAAYEAEADSLYMDWQAALAEGNKTAAETDHLKQVWLNKRAEIKTRFA